MTHTGPDASFNSFGKTVEERLSALESENQHLKKRISELELQVAQITERALMNLSSCSSSGHRVLCTGYNSAAPLL